MSKLPAVALLAAVALAAPAQAAKDRDKHQSPPQPRRAATATLQSATQVVDLSGVWMFHAGDNPSFSRSSLDDSGWEQHRVPLQTLDRAARWAGIGWYRMHLEVTAETAGLDMSMSLGPLREVAEVYVNGALVAERGRFGSRPVGGARVLPLTAHLPAGLLVPGDNVIAVRVLDPSYAGGIVSGPLLLGPASLLATRADASLVPAFALRVVLALFALCIGLGQWLVRGRGDRRPSFLLAVAALSLCVAHLCGVGVLEALLPSLDFAIRLPWIALASATLAIARYFAVRFGDPGSLIAKGLLSLCALVGLLMIFAPEQAIAVAAAPALITTALLVAIDASRLLVHAGQRGEPHTVSIFVVAFATALAALFDAIASNPLSAYPPWSSVFAIALLLSAALSTARQASREQDDVWNRLLEVERTLAELPNLSLLSAAAQVEHQPAVFLDLAVREAAVSLHVRRCSLIVEQPDQSLRVVASVGLPKAVTLEPIARTGIAEQVLRTGEKATPSNRAEAAERRAHYQTDAFVAQPIFIGPRCVAVLSVSDRHDGSQFTTEDEHRVATVADQVAWVMRRLATDDPRLALAKG